MKKCPYCAEEIQDAAVVCRHCSRDLKSGAVLVAVPPKKRTSCATWGCLLTLIAAGSIWVVMENASPSPSAKNAPAPGAQQPSAVATESADQAAKQELMKTPWVKDAFVSPGHMNVGVLREEKDWSAPMIGKFECGVLRKNGSRLTWVRFVDIRAVANEGKSPNQAEIHKYRCQ